MRGKLRLPRQAADVASCVLVWLNSFPLFYLFLLLSLSLSLSLQVWLSCCALSFLVAEAAATFLVAPFDFMALFSAACSVNLGKAVVAGFFMSVCVCLRECACVRVHACALLSAWAWPGLALWYVANGSAYVIIGIPPFPT